MPRPDGIPCIYQYNGYRNGAQPSPSQNPYVGQSETALAGILTKAFTVVFNKITKSLGL